MYRLNCFIYIHKLINSSEFEILHHHSTSKGITLRSPIQKLIEAKGKENSNESKEVTQTKSQSKTNTSTTNVNLHQMISQKMFISCLVAITIDFIYFFVYAFPLCYSLYIHQLGNSGFILFNIILIAYQCDNGALFIGNTLGRTPFGHPITPTKTVEGVIGGVFFGYGVIYHL